MLSHVVNAGWPRSAHVFRQSSSCSEKHDKRNKWDERLPSRQHAHELLLRTCADVSDGDNDPPTSHRPESSYRPPSSTLISLNSVTLLGLLPRQSFKYLSASKLSNLRENFSVSSAQKHEIPSSNKMEQQEEGRDGRGRVPDTSCASPATERTGRPHTKTDAPEEMLFSTTAYSTSLCWRLCFVFRCFSFSRSEPVNRSPRPPPHVCHAC